MQVSDILKEGDSPISSATDCPVSVKHPCYAQLSYLKARVSPSLSKALRTAPSEERICSRKQTGRGEHGRVKAPRWDANQDLGYMFALQCKGCLKVAFNTRLSTALMANRKA